MLEVFSASQALLAAQQGGSGILTMPGMLIIFMFFMYFVMIRPQRQKEKKHMEAVSRLKKNDEVLLEGGIYGEVFSVEKDTVMVKIADKVVIKVHQRGVRVILTGENADQEATTTDKK